MAGLSAAYLHGFPGARLGRPVIMVPTNGNARSRLADVIRCKDFANVARRRVDGFPVTNPTETILTLAAKHPQEYLERLVDDVLLSRSGEIEDFDRVLARKVPGVVALSRVVNLRRDSAYQPPTSELERLLEPILSHPEIPAVTRQHPALLKEVPAVVACFIDRWLLIVEADGRRWHTRRADFERDRTRDNAATAAGIAILRFTWEMLKRRPADCLAILIETGRARAGIQSLRG